MSFSYYHPNFRSVLLPSAYSILYIFIFLVRNFPLIYLSISLLQLPGLTIISTIYTIFLSQISPISYFSLLWTPWFGSSFLATRGSNGWDSSIIKHIFLRHAWNILIAIPWFIKYPSEWDTASKIGDSLSLSRRLGGIYFQLSIIPLFQVLPFFLFSLPIPFEFSLLPLYNPVPGFSTFHCFSLSPMLSASP